MPRTSEIDRIVSALAYRLASPRTSTLSRRSVSRISSAVAYTLAGGRGRGTSSSGRSAATRVASAVAFRLRTTTRRSPIVARLASGRSGASAVSRPSTRRISSLIADRLAAQPEVRQRSRVSVDALASAVTRRLRYADQTGVYPVSAVASRVARLLTRRQTGAVERVSGRREADALASSISKYLARSQGGLPVNQERDPGR
jgi:hypothetical protein